jgi:hypothetical protein
VRICSSLGTCSSITSCCGARIWIDRIWADARLTIIGKRIAYLIVLFTFVLIFRLISETEELGTNSHSSSGAYPNVSVELEMDSLAVCALMQATQILQTEGTSVSTSFGAQSQALIPDAMGIVFN